VRMISPLAARRPRGHRRCGFQRRDVPRKILHLDRQVMVKVRVAMQRHISRRVAVVRHARRRGLVRRSRRVGVQHPHPAHTGRDVTEPWVLLRDAYLQHRITARESKRRLDVVQRRRCPVDPDVRVGVFALCAERVICAKAQGVLPFSEQAVVDVNVVEQRRRAWLLERAVARIDVIAEEELLTFGVASEHREALHA
jgi:hypothetical protein